MRAHHLLHLAALGAGLLLLSGCPDDDTTTPGDIDTAVSTVTVSRAKGVAADGVDKSIIEVRLMDKDQNPIPAKTVELVATGGGNILVQPASATNDYGVATGSIASTEAEIKTLSAKVGSITLDARPTVEFVSTVSTPTKLAFTVQPTSAVVGASLSPAVTVSFLDDSNAVTPVTSTVTLKLGDNPGTATLGGTVSAAAVDGVATFANLTLSAVGKGYTLVASAEGLSDVTSQRFDVNAGAATALVLSALPATAAAGESLGFTVTAQDEHGNVATGYTGTVTITSGDAQATLPAAYTFTATDAGAHAFTGLVLKTAGEQTVTAADGTLTIAGTVSVSAGAAIHLEASGLASPFVAGTTGTLTVVAKDAFGNVKTDYAGTVQISVENAADPAAGLPDPYTFTAADLGTHDFAVVLTTAGLHDVVAADLNDGGATSGMQSGVQVVAEAEAAALAVAGLPASVPSGSPASFTVTAVDHFGNTVADYAGQVSFATGIAGDTLPAQSTLTNGTGSFEATFLTVGARTLTVGDGTISGTAATTVTVGTTLHLVFTGQTVSTSAGAMLDVEVTVKDAAGNVDTGFAGQVTMAKASGTGDLLGTTTATAYLGVATFAAMHIDVAGTYTLSASAAGVASATSDEFTVAPETAHHLAFTVQPTSTTAGSPLVVEVTARDFLNNKATSFNGDVTLAKASSSTGSGALLPTATVTKTAENGVASFAVADALHFDVAGSYALTATATGLTAATSNAFDVGVGTNTQLVFTAAPTSVTAGAPIALTIKVQDDLGNTDTAFNGSVAVAKASGPGSLAGTVSVTAAQGVATFGDTENLHFDLVGDYTLLASASGPASGTSGTIAVVPGAAHHLAFTVQPADAAVNAALNFAVTALDALGNTATDFVAEVTIAKAASSEGAGELLPTATVAKAATLGEALFSDPDGLHFDTVGYYALEASAAGLTSATSHTFGVGGGTAVGFILTGLSQATAGVPASVTLTAVDALGVTMTGYTGTVHFTTAETGATLPVDEAFAAADQGVKTFNGVVFTVATTTASLKAEQLDDAAVSGSVQNIEVLAAEAKALAFQTMPTSTMLNGTMAAVEVKVVDDFGNTQATPARDVTVALENNAGGATLGGTTTVATVDGVATFSTLSLDKVGLGYTLRADSAGLTGIISDAFAIADCVQDVDCDDSDACTTDTCVDSICTHGTVTCDIGDACVSYACQPASGCVASYETCNDGDACTSDSCDASLGGCQNVGISCDDSNACTTDTCDSSTGCVNTDASASCTGSAPCTTYGCDQASGCTSSYCGGSTTALCISGACCEPSTCTDEGRGCGTSSCGAPCGTCGTGYACDAGACIYRHTVDVSDGSNDFVAGLEMTNTTNAQTNAYIAWDDANLYIGYAGPKVGGGSDKVWLMVYLDTDPGGAMGSTTGQTFNTQKATMPLGFKADFQYAANQSFSYAQTATYNAGTSSWVASPTVPPAHSGNYLEFAIPLSDLGDPAPTKVGIVTYMIDETSMGEKTWAGLYADNFAPDDVYYSNLPLSRYLLADFSVNAAPNAAANMRGDEAYTSAQIQAVRATADGTGLSLPIERAVVTYKKNAMAGGTGNDLAGFFVQAEKAGPALYVAVAADADLAGLNVGDKVNLNVTAIATVNGMKAATADAPVVVSSGYDVSKLVQNVDSETVANLLGQYESELIAGTFTVAAAFANSGSADFQAANVTTTGVPTAPTASPYFRLRMPTTLRSQYDLVTGCKVVLSKTPLFLFATTSTYVEPSAWVASDFTVSNCPAPKVVSAVAPTATSVVVTFDRNVLASSVNANGSQFTLSGNLAPTATGATVSGTTVTLTTAAQTTGTTYTVTVANSVTDTLGTPIDGTANSTTFDAFVPPLAPALVINEVAAAGPGGASDEFIELFNGTNAEIDVGTYTLYYRGPTSTTNSKLVTLTGKKIPARSYLLVAPTAFTGPTPDVNFAAGLGGAGGSVWLSATATFPASMAAAVDVVGYGTANASNSEGGHAAPAHSSPQSVQRRTVGADTNDNARDFVLLTTRDPKNSASPAEP